MAAETTDRPEGGDDFTKVNARNKVTSEDVVAKKVDEKSEQVDSQVDENEESDSDNDPYVHEPDVSYAKDDSEDDSDEDSEED